MIGTPAVHHSGIETIGYEPRCSSEIKYMTAILVLKGVGQILGGRGRRPQPSLVTEN